MQEQIVDIFVPNDARIVGGVGVNSVIHEPGDAERNNVLLCTGANACGKVRLIASYVFTTPNVLPLQSVYLKQV